MRASDVIFHASGERDSTSTIDNPCSPPINTNLSKARKLSALNKLLDQIKKRKKNHYSKFRRIRGLNTSFSAVINLLNVISVTSLIILFINNPVAKYIIAGSSTTSALITAVLSKMNLEFKYISHHTSYLQYNDIYRDFNAKIIKNHLSPADLDTMLGELNARLGLIEDSSEPISITLG